MTQEMIYFKPVPNPNGTIDFIPSSEPYVPEGPAQPIELPYDLKRARAYPSVTDQLEMLWHMMDDDILPGKGSDWYNAILAVKTAHPKPE